MRSNSFICKLLALLSLAPQAGFALEPGLPILASRNFQGGVPFGPCSEARFSSNGRYLVFTCRSSDIVLDDDNDRYDTFRLDRRNGEVRRVSLNAANEEQRENSTGGIPSADGRVVVFTGEGKFHPDVGDLPPGPADANVPNVFLRDFVAGSTELLSRDINGVGNPEVVDGSMLLDADPARHEVLFASAANYLGGADTLPSFSTEVFLRNWQTGAIERISARADGGQSNGQASLGAMSPDGRFVAFSSNATDFPENPSGFDLFFLRDRTERTTTRFVRPWHGGEFTFLPPFGGPIFSSQPKLSSEARHIIFAVGLNDEITADDNPGYGDVYLFNRESGTTELLSRSHDGTPTDGSAFEGDISSDGRIVAFFTRATNTLPAPNPAPAIYVKDRLTGETVNVTAALGAPRPFHIPRMDLSPDGRTLAFSWWGGDPGQPAVYNRTLVYTVALGDPQPPPATAVPALTRQALAALVLLLALAGSLVLPLSRR